MVRVNHAKPLLKSMQVPITDIAKRAGFAEHRAMLAAFENTVALHQQRIASSITPILNDAPMMSA